MDGLFKSNGPDSKPVIKVCRSLMLMKATKVCKQKCYSLTFFCPADDPMALYAKGTRAAPGKQKMLVKELVVDNATNTSSSNINKISVFGKGKVLFSLT